MNIIIMFFVTLYKTTWCKKVFERFEVKIEVRIAHFVTFSVYPGQFPLFNHFIDKYSGEKAT